MSYGLVSGGRRVLWAAVLAASCTGAASAGTVIINANNSYNPPASTGDFVKKGDTSFGLGTLGIAGSNGWQYTQVATQTTVGINTTYTDLQVGNGSIYFKSTGTSASGPGKAEVKLSNSSGIGGTLAELSSLSYDWYRDSSESSSNLAKHLVPVLRLYLQGGTTLIYELAENGYNSSTNVPATDTWVTSDAYQGGAAKFWRSGTGGTKLTDLVATYGNRQIIGIGVGVGSGWDGTFVGAADNITIGFTKKGVQSVTTYNFEVNGAPMPQAPAVPEPTSIAMGLIAGAAGLVMAARRRRSA